MFYDPKTTNDEVNIKSRKTDTTTNELMLAVEHSQKWTQFVLIYQVISFSINVLISLMFYLYPTNCLIDHSKN